LVGGKGRQAGTRPTKQTAGGGEADWSSEGVWPEAGVESVAAARRGVGLRGGGCALERGGVEVEEGLLHVRLGLGEEASCEGFLREERVKGDC